MLSKENKDLLKEMLDVWLDLSGWKELASDLGIKIGVDQLDKLLDKYIKPEDQKRLNDVFVYIREKDYPGAIAQLDDIMDDMIDLPWFGDVTEELLFEGLFKIFQAILMQVQINACDPDKE